MKANVMNMLSGDFDQNMKAMNAKIKELQPLIDAQGGITRINQMEVSAKSKAEIADTLLNNAKDESERVITKAQKEAEELLNSAKERSEQVKRLAEAELLKANQLQAELKTEALTTAKAKSELEKAKSALAKRERELDEIEAEIARKVEVLKQL